MKHHKSIRKFGRKRDVRKALISSLTRSLVLEEKIKTTEAKAKELRPHVEKIVTAGKSQTLAAQRKIAALVDKEVAKKVVSDLSKRYDTRPGGYTRIIKLPRRQGDAAKMAVIEFV